MVKKGERTSEELLEEIVNKLDDLLTLFAIQDKEKVEQIKIMVTKGYSNGQISNLLGIPKGTVDGIRAGLSKKIISHRIRRRDRKGRRLRGGLKASA